MERVGSWDDSAQQDERVRSLGFHELWKALHLAQ